MQQRLWERKRIYLCLVEHLLYAVTMLLIPLYLIKFPFNFSAFYLMILPCVSLVINLFFLRHQQSPCNATFQIAIKSVIILRLLLALFVSFKIERTFGPDNEWSWQKTFWAYWLSTTVQAVLFVACIVVFLNTLLAFVKAEQSIHDGKSFSFIFANNLCLISIFFLNIVLGSFWITLMIGGFLMSSLQMVLQIVRIFDIAP